MYNLYPLKNMNKIKEYINARKQKAQFEHEAQIKSEFKVVERNGLLWLTHDGVAFMKIANLAQAEDITKELNKARECAVEYERL